MTDEKDIFKVEPSSENFDTWISKDFVSEDIRQSLRAAAILIVPTLGFREKNEPTFPVGTEEFLAYFKEKLPKEFSIDICIADEQYYELALHSNYKRIGKFLVSTVALGVFLNIFSSYIYDNILKDEESKPAIQIINIDNSNHTTIVNPAPEKNAPKKYMEPQKVKFTITVVDTNGTSKDFHYEGPAKDAKNITDQIKKLWDNEHK